MTGLHEVLGDACFSVPCAFCGAGRQRHCQTKSGRKASRFHAARQTVFIEVWRSGWRNGVSDAVDFVEHRCDPNKADLDPRGTLERTLTNMKGWFRE